MKSKSLTLTRDELLVFLAIMKSSTMIGLEDKPLAGLSKEEMAIRLNSGEQSLLNRGLIEFKGEDGLVLDDALVALVGGSMVPDATFVLTRIEADNSSDPHYFHVSSNLIVEFYSPRVGIYCFDYIGNIATLTKRVEELLAPMQCYSQPQVGLSHKISARAFARFMALGKQQELEQAQQAPTKLWAEMAARVAEDYVVSTTWVGGVVWGLRSQKADGSNSVMTIMGNERYWLVENIKNQPKFVKISPANGKQCKKAFLSLLQPLPEVFEK